MAESDRKMKIDFKKTGTFTALIFGLMTQLFAAAPPSRPGDSGGNGTSGTTVPTPGCVVGQSRSELDINNVRARYLNAGDMFWDPGLSLPKYEVPKRNDNLTTSKNSIFAAAIWLGGKERGTNNVLVMVQTYRGGLRNYWPGPIFNLNAADTSVSAPTTKKEICAAWDRHFKCNRSTVKKFVDDFEAGLISCDNIPTEIKLWPGKGNPFLKQETAFAADPLAAASVDNNLANFYDKDTNGIYNPCKGDFPLWAGTEADNNCPGGIIDIKAGADQVIWWVCNDGGDKKNFSENTSVVPEIGMEIHYEAFAYASTDATNDMTFLRQKLYNKGSYILDSTYLAQWVDPDLGNAGDDFVGCDVLRGLAICYNGDEVDEGQSGYGENPPAVGVDFFRGPFPDDKFDAIDWDLDCSGATDLVPDTNERITMSGFVYYNIGGNPRNGDPTKYTDFYNMLRNKWKDGTDITWGGAGLDPLNTTDHPKASYMFPNVTSSSDPYGFACGATSCSEARVCPGEWNEKQAGNAPGDRRFLANNGPFTLEPGDFNECTIGIVWARATSGGPTGSFTKLLAADDLAQERFNDCFKRNVGPNSPDLEIIENDKELVFSIIPDTIVRSPLMTTETYTELDRRVSIGDPANPQDLLYRFQGYKVYQLADDKVSVQDLGNPDKARLLEGDVDGDGNSDFSGVMDLEDGVTNISNLLFNPDLDAEILTPMVKNSPDKGIFRTFKVGRDMFNSSGSLSNFKKYYYAVISYGYIRNNQEKRPYIQGVENYKVYAAIPHKINPEVFGSQTSFTFGSGLPVTRIHGIGNNGNKLELADGEEQAILQNGFKDEVSYLAGAGPVDIKVYNPKAIRGGEFEIKFSSRLRYKPGNYAFSVGDVILSDTGRPIVAPFNLLRKREPFAQGRAVVKRVVSAGSGFVDLDLDLSINSGDFSYKLDLAELERGQFILKQSGEQGLKFRLESDTSKSGLTEEFARFDFWTLTEKNSGLSVSAEKPVSAVSEQIIPEFGISLRPKNPANPGSDISNPLSKNGAISAELITDSDPLKQWIYGISPNGSAFDPGFNYIRGDAYAVGSDYYALDQKGTYKSFAENGWIPYILSEKATLPLSATSPNSEGGPQIVQATNPFDYDSELTLSSLSKIGNVDIVFTADKSKWTRCVVLQCDSFGGSSGSTRKRFTMAKSRRLSVNKDFAPDGSSATYDPALASRGMSWFPGYAIDLDKGERLNMIFTESVILDSENGNNLQWEPRVGLSGNRNFIMVMNSRYDEGKAAERSIDSIFTVNTALNPTLEAYRKWSVSNIMYAGLMGRGIDFINARELPLLLTDARVKLRVEKSYANYRSSASEFGSNPTYRFKIENVNIRNNTQVGKSALDLIRVAPNPYFSQSLYENSQIDSRVKIVNLPSQCVVSIFNLSGTLVRQFNFDQSSSLPYSSNAEGVNIYSGRGTNYQTFLDWDLKNQNGIPIASGVYLIHVKSEKLGEKVIKWFGVLRPIDLDSFN